MTDPVRDYAPTFADRFEGKVPWMYLDVKGLVTVARGNLVDPVQYALPLTFMTKDGREADVNEVLVQWNAIKAAKFLAKAGHMAVINMLGDKLLQMSEQEMNRVFFQKFDQNERHLTGRFPEMPQWPQDARLFAHSMAWACGPGFRYPLLEAFLRAQQFGNAVAECTIDETGNPGVVKRNVANRILLRNAEKVVMSSTDRKELHYPTELKVPPSEAQAFTAGENPNSEIMTGSGSTIHILDYFGDPI